MKFSIEEFELIEEWSKLSLSQEERENLHKDLEKVLESLSSIEDIPGDGEEPQGDSLITPDDLREDRVDPPMDRDLALKNAPRVEEGMFRVPIILE